jgi:hypothetical protein
MEKSPPFSKLAAVELNAKLPTTLLAAPLKIPPKDEIGPLGPIWGTLLLKDPNAGLIEGKSSGSKANSTAGIVR